MIEIEKWWIVKFYSKEAESVTTIRKFGLLTNIKEKIMEDGHGYISAIQDE